MNNMDYLSIVKRKCLNFGSKLHKISYFATKTRAATEFLSRLTGIFIMTMKKLKFRKDFFAK